MSSWLGPMPQSSAYVFFLIKGVSMVRWERSGFCWFLGCQQTWGGRRMWASISLKDSSNSDTRLRSFIKAMSPEEPLLRTIWILYFNPEHYYSRVFVTDSWLFPIIRSISTNGCTVWLWGRYVLVLYRKSTKFYEKEKTSQSGSKKWNITLTWFSRTQVPACFIIPLF
jgi:hypothetical protein